MRAFSRLFLVCAVLVVAVPLAWADNGFRTARGNGWEDYAYAYKDGRGVVRQVYFRLNAGDIALGEAEFRAFDGNEARAVALKGAQNMALQLESPALKVSVADDPEGMDIHLVGRGVDKAKMQALGDVVSARLNDAYVADLQAYAAKHYYMAEPKGNGRTVIRPDYVAVAKRYSAAMRPVAQAIMGQVDGAANSPRAFVEAAMAWLQSIPYDTLEDRYTSNGAGFQTPYGLIAANKGDCDTKATALAALILAAYPNVPLAVITIPDHAFLGVGLPQEGNDFALQTGRGTYVLADATGPGLVPLGYIDDRTQYFARGGEAEVFQVR